MHHGRGHAEGARGSNANAGQFAESRGYNTAGLTPSAATTRTLEWRFVEGSGTVERLRKSGIGSEAGAVVNESSLASREHVRGVRRMACRAELNDTSWVTAGIEGRVGG